MSSFRVGAVGASPNDMHARCTARTHASEKAEAVLLSTLRRQFGMVIDDREEWEQDKVNAGVKALRSEPATWPPELQTQWARTIQGVDYANTTDPEY